MKKEIKLTQGLVAIVDEEDFDYLNQWKWQAVKLQRSRTFYALRKVWDGNRQVTTYLHRVIMGVYDGSIEVDHKDRNGLNNSRSNLRVCSRAQNTANVTKRMNTSSKYLGVTWDKQTGKWQAAIQKNKKTIKIGRFISEYEAGEAYKKAAILLHGEFANVG